HERWDGSGYPNGIGGETIPLSGRIVAVADVFDALTTARPYKQAWSPQEARAYLLDKSGSHFDPGVVAAFLSRWADIAAQLNSVSEAA
ncbi:HD-GYP domain-containing protein, partial [Methylobacterium segetis]